MIADHDGTEINLETLCHNLEVYAKGVMQKMQKADPEFADCWSACLITFDGIQPNFEWGSMEDLDDEYGVYIEMPLKGLTNKAKNEV